MSDSAAAAVVAAPVIGAGPSPHLHDAATTHGVMRDVLIALLPVIVAAIWVFGWHALLQLALASAACLAVEAVAARWRGRRIPLADGSALITGLILGLSLPWSAPAYVPIIGGLVAIGIAKALFGGLGHNLFNPAMVGRAFVMISFSGVLGAGAYVAADAGDVLSQATPLTAVRGDGALPDAWILFLGKHNGSLGESSLLACLLGGAWLCWRRAARWEIPVALIATVALLALLGGLAEPVPGLPALHLGVVGHLGSGALVFGAFFIATDPVTSPMSRRGIIAFAILIGLVVWILRVFSNYPEGVMFAVLVGNAVAPLLDRWTVPTPVGGRVPA